MHAATVNEFNEFNVWAENMHDRKIRETARQVADFCREQVEAGAMTPSEADAFGNAWMADVQERHRGEAF